MSVKIFLSTVSDEFGGHRDLLRADLTRHNVEVKVQEDFKDLGGSTLDELDVYISHSDAVVHLVGDMTGAFPGERALGGLRTRYPDLEEKLPPLGEALKTGLSVSYTQWEAWLAIYHGTLLFIAKAAETAERGPKYAPTEGSRSSQARHLVLLEAIERFPGCTFSNADNLAKSILGGAILDLLVKAYAQDSARARDVAEGFIVELAKKVAGDRNLDFEGKKQAVRNAIDIYEREILGGQTPTNTDAIVEEALTRARSLVDAGKSGLAQATLRRAADEMRREDEERRARYLAGITALYNRARDVALAAYDGPSAAEAIALLAEAIHGSNISAVAPALNSEAATLFQHGRDRGSNVHLAASIALRRKLLSAALSDRDRGFGYHDLGVALCMLGARESGTDKLEEAVSAFREALKERTRESAPLEWATTQMNLGTALARLGERDNETGRLEEAIAAYREALKEEMRERVPLEWAKTQNNLGNALARLGERQKGAEKLKEAVAAYRDALQERTRERVPLEWAATQNNLGNALRALGARDGEMDELEEAVAAYREALKERTRERVPLDWAMTKTNLGNALLRLGEREPGVGRLDEAVAAYREALEERTRERVPLEWAMTQMNLGAALTRLGERRTGTAELEEAVAAYREALGERTRERVPLDWAMTQDNLGTVLSVLGGRETGAGRVEEAVVAYREALKERTRERVPLDWAMTQMNLGAALAELGEREDGSDRLEESASAYCEALKETKDAAPYWHRIGQESLARVNARRAQRRGSVQEPTSKSN